MTTSSRVLDGLLSVLQMSEAEQQFVNTSQRVRKEFEAKLEEVRRAGEEDVHLRMDAGTKRIMQQNRSLQEELRIHIEVCTVLLSASCCLRLPNTERMAGTCAACLSTCCALLTCSDVTRRLLFLRAYKHDLPNINNLLPCTLRSDAIAPFLLSQQSKLQLCSG